MCILLQYLYRRLPYIRRLEYTPTIINYRTTLDAQVRGYLVSFVTKKVDLREVIEISQAVSFVPSFRENLRQKQVHVIKLISPNFFHYFFKMNHNKILAITHVKTYLSSDRKGEVKLCKLLTKDGHQLRTYIVNLNLAFYWLNVYNLHTYLVKK